MPKRNPIYWGAAKQLQTAPAGFTRAHTADTFASQEDAQVAARTLLGEGRNAVLVYTPAVKRKGAQPWAVYVKAYAHKNPSRPAPANAVFFATTKGDGHQIIVTPYDAESYDFGVYSGGDKWWDGLLDADAVRKSIALELPNQKYMVKIDKLPKSNPKLDKVLLVPLRREDRGIKDDPQFSPYLRGEQYIVFFDYGHPTHLGSRGFKTKRDAAEWIASKVGATPKSNPKPPASLPGWRQLEVGYGHTVWLPVGNYAKITKHVDRDGTPSYHVTVDERFKRAWGTLKGAQRWAAEQYGGAKSNPSAPTLTLKDQHGRTVQLPWRTVKDGRPGNESIALRASFYADPNDTTREWVSGSITRDGKVVATWPRPMRAGRTVANPRYASGPYTEKIKLPGWNGKTRLEHAPAPRVRAAFPGADHAAAIEKAIVHANAAARAYNRTMKAAIAKHGEPHPWISGIGSESFPEATKQLLRKQLVAFNRAQDAVALHYKAMGKRAPLHQSTHVQQLVKAGGYGLGSAKGNPKRNPSTAAPRLVVRRGRLDGLTVYVVKNADTGETVEPALRASDFLEAKEKVRRKYPNAKVKGSFPTKPRSNPAPFYGAPMGYGSRPEAPDTATTLLVRRVKLDSGGYASDGAYFGIGRPVYVVANADTGSVVESLRAADFVDAKEKMRSKYPNAKVK